MSPDATTPKQTQVSAIPLRKERRALWASLPRESRPDWDRFNRLQMWKKVA
jgi:hypothetical protein